MTQATVPGYVYTVYTAGGCTVTAPGFPAFSVTCSPGMANSFTAPGDKVEISDPAANLVAVRTFNGALAALGLLGGGNTLPAGYTRLEYLESTNAGQVIILPIALNSASRVRLKFKRKASVSVVAVQCVDDNYGYAVWPSTHSGNNMGLQYGTCAANYENLAPTTQADYRIFEIDVTPPMWTIATTEEDPTLKNPTGTRTLKNPGGWIIESQETWLFRPQTGGYAYPFRLYSATLHNGEKQMNLIPALDETGAPCLFDTVSRTSFYNAGTGDFVYPTESSTYGLRRVLPDWGKLTPTGLRRLYHVPDGYRGDILQFAAENGFCPIQEEEQPAEGYWAPRWEEIGGIIYLSWEATAPPEEI